MRGGQSRLWCLLGVMLLVSCGRSQFGTDGDSNRFCNATENLVEAPRDAPTDLDPTQADTYAELEEMLAVTDEAVADVDRALGTMTEAAPSKVAEALRTMDEIDADTLRVSEQEALTSTGARQ